MQAETGAQGCAGGDAAGVAARTAAGVAVGQAARGAVVACGEDAVVVDEDAADATFHAIGAQAGEVGQVHEVGVPGGAEARRRRDVERGQERKVLGCGRWVVEDLEVSARSQ